MKTAKTTKTAMYAACLAASLTSCERAERPQERLGTLRLPVEDNSTCFEPAGRMPTATWRLDLEGVQQLSSREIDIGNPYAETVSATITLSAHGLDQRFVKRTLETIAIGGQQATTYTVDLAALPIQGISFSSLGIVEVALQRPSGEVVRTTSDPFYYHFDEEYGDPSVYTFSTLDDELSDGQLGVDAFDLRGRVWRDDDWIDIDELRLEEGLPEQWMGSTFGTNNPAWTDPPEPEPPPAGAGKQVCMTLRTKFIDSGKGEDLASNLEDQVVPASYMWISIYRVISQPCAALYKTESCLAHHWTGWLDKYGCRLLGTAPAGDYVIWTSGVFEAEIAPTRDSNAYVELWDPVTDELHGQFGWRTPLQILSGPSAPSDYFVLVPFNPINNPTAAVAQILSRSDLALEPTMFKSNPDVYIHAHRRPISTQPGVSRDDARANHNQVATGDWIRHDNGRPGGMQYKSILAHEYGHSLMWHGTEGFEIQQLYNDDSPTQPLCTCADVTSANKLHCLQSREHIGVAQHEGFAHFVSAKAWNVPSESNCWFPYYKEFTQSTGTTDPPFGFDCYNPLKWRNNECFAATRGTEQDWLLFFWNVNSRGVNTTALADLWTILNDACGGNCLGEPGLPWTTLRSAADAHFTGLGKLQEFAHFDSWGGLAGVNETP